MQVLDKSELAQAKAKFILGWLFDARSDLLIFYGSICPAIIAYLLLFQVKDSLVLAALLAQGLGLGPLHQGVTFFHLLDRTNQRYCFDRKRIFKYLVVPLLLLALTVSGMLWSAQLVLTVYLLWTVQHIAQQNVGLLLLYHKPQLGEACASRETEIKSQHAAAALFSFVFLLRYAQSTATAPWLLLLIALLTVEAAVRGARYILELSRAVRTGAALNLPALAFWLLSMFFFAPMALPAVDLNQALLIPLVMHWCQYIGLNWIIVQRKYEGRRRSDALLARPKLALFICGFALVCFAFFSSAISTHLLLSDGTVTRVAAGLLLGMGFVHYWHDALIWRFREPHNRENMLAFIRS